MNRRSFCALALLAASMMLLSIHACGIASVNAAAESMAECVIEASSKRVLHEKNGRDCLPMASTTKIMTALLIIDDCDLSQTVTVPQAAVGIEGSSVYLKAGESYTVEDLLYGLMLRSGNDCAVALALYHSGSVEAFARKMNEKACYLGAEDTFFANPHGLPAKGHHTTARDLALISAYAIENPTFRQIVSCKYYEKYGWKNKNKMLWNFDGAIGVKTGFTMDAGRCLVMSAERNGMKIVSVVLNSPQMFERSSELLEKCFGDYHMECLFDCQEPVEGLSARRSFLYPLREGEREKVSVRVEKIQPLPPEHGEFAGTMQIYLENSLIFCQNLYII